MQYHDPDLLISFIQWQLWNSSRIGNVWFSAKSTRIMHCVSVRVSFNSLRYYICALEMKERLVRSWILLISNSLKTLMDIIWVTRFAQSVDSHYLKLISSSSSNSFNQYFKWAVRTLMLQQLLHLYAADFQKFLCYK